MGLTDMRSLGARLLVLGLLAPFAAPATPQPAGEPFAYPGKHWESFAPASLPDECRLQLQAAQSRLQTMDTTALVAVRDGRVLFSYGKTDTVSVVFSVRKSILALLYGNPVENGTVDLTQTLQALGIDDTGGLLPVERQARLGHLLTARSGVYHAAVNGGDDLHAAPPRGSQTPGSYFLYNNWDFNAAGTVFEKQTGQSIYRAFENDLAKPMELEDFDITRHRRTGDRAKSVHAAYHFQLSTRDMARLGYLVLRQGAWRGRQLVPAAWVARITATVTPAAEMHPAKTASRGFGYGYMWWTLRDRPETALRNASMAWGVHGQYILVVPEHNLVIAHKRQVPVAGEWNVSWVQPADFLAVAQMLAAAPCP